jgi:hypothetical protein
MDLGGERVLAHLADRIGEQLSASQDSPALGPIDVATCPGNAGVVLLGMIYAAGTAGLGLVRAAGVQQGFLITETTGNSRV